MVRLLNRFGQFLLDYKLFSLSIAAVMVGLTLQVLGRTTAVHWTLGIVSLISALPIVRDMWQDVRDGRYGIDILAVTAIVASVWLGQYWAAIVIVVMFTGGAALEDFAEHRAKTELDALLSRAPRRATVIRKGKTMQISVVDIRVGDVVLIKPGEVVPVDSVITEGTADFDESSLTGESLPQAKQPHDLLLSGSASIDGAVSAKAIRVAADSQYEQIIRLVRTAAATQAPVVRLADRYAVPFTLAAYAIAVGAWLIGHQAIRFLEVIVVATPCPLLLAAPIAVISGMSRAAKQGIIVKTGAALEQFAHVQTIAFDKTGTLTRGELVVDRLVAYGSFKKSDVLSLAAALEQNSNHVLAQAIVAEAKRLGLKIPKAKQVKETPGRGVTATTSGKSVLIGKLDFLTEHHVVSPTRLIGDSHNQTATYVAIDGKLAGLFTFKDEARPESKPIVKRLLDLGVRKVLMVTGDNPSAAKAIARTVGIKEVHAHMLPADKLRIVEQLKERPVAFVGDGVNDAPVLMASEIGIALGARGVSAASQSADMVILLDDLSRVAVALSIAKRAFAIARQSILGGICLSVILMFVFATGKFPALTGAIVQECVDVIVIFNALRAHSGNQELIARG